MYCREDNRNGRSASGCKNEWVWALKYKKPVISLRLHPDADLPFQLASRQYVDLSDDLDVGLARVCVFLADTASPKGLLRELRYRLADAERELPRTRDDQQRQRIEQDVQALRQQITEQDLQSRDPQAAAAVTDQRITANMEAVRQPERPEPAVVARARFVKRAGQTVGGYAAWSCRWGVWLKSGYQRR